MDMMARGRFVLSCWLKGVNYCNNIFPVKKGVYR